MPRKPTDATIRNVRAANKKIKALEAQMKFVKFVLREVCAKVTKLEKRK